MKEEAWQRATVTHRHEWTDGLFTLTTDLELDFKPGQFVAIGLPDENEKGGRLHRLFSIASAPGKALEFFVVRVDGGALSPRLDRLRPGDDLWVHMAPKGVFTLDRVPSADNVWFLATGTGLAPFIAMLRTDEPWERFGKIVMVQGVRLKRDLAYLPELEAMSRAHGGKLVQVLSVTREECGPEIYHGRIPSAMDDGKLVELAGVPLTPETSQILLCGNPEMIKQVSAMLQERGFRNNSPKNPGHITFERYW
ncbi:MAG: ferredoxin--NADP reductase [bacterium]